jgi:hypothetical protein
MAAADPLMKPPKKADRAARRQLLLEALRRPNMNIETIPRP